MFNLYTPVDIDEVFCLDGYCLDMQGRFTLVGSRRFCGWSREGGVGRAARLLQNAVAHMKYCALMS